MNHNDEMTWTRTRQIRACAQIRHPPHLSALFVNGYGWVEAVSVTVLEAEGLCRGRCGLCLEPSVVSVVAAVAVVVAAGKKEASTFRSTSPSPFAATAEECGEVLGGLGMESADAMAVDAKANGFVAIEVAGWLGVDVVLDADSFDADRHDELERPLHLRQIAALAILVLLHRQCACRSTWPPPRTNHKSP